MKLCIKSGMLYEVRDVQAVTPTGAATPKQVIRIIGTRRDHETNELSTVALIRCDRVSTPWPTPYGWFEERVARGEFVQVDESINPAAPGIRCSEDLQDKERKAAFQEAIADNSALIAPVLSLGWAAFDIHERNKVLRQIALGSVDGKRHSVRWLNTLLWRFWTGGALALGPQYYKCGAHTRAEIAELIRNKKTPKTGRRAGRTVKVITAAKALSVHDRGGSYIDAFAEAVISSLITDYFNDPLRAKEIEICLHRRGNRLPWTPITTYVNGRLSKMPDYSSIDASVAQIRYIGIRNVSVLGVMNKALDKRYMTLNHRERHGDYRDVAFCAGHRYEVDAVCADIHLVDDITRMPIGRPNIVFVVDTYTGAIVGLYVTVENISLPHVLRALHCAFSPKPEWCLATVGLEIQGYAWSPRGRCGNVTADNAQLLDGAAKTVPELIADVGICPAYRPDLKGLVESTAELANLGVIHLFRYGVTKGPKERAKKDPAKDATVSVQTFTRELVRWVVDVANHRPLPVDRELDPGFLATGLTPTPFNVWNWSQQEHGGPPHAYDKNTWMPRLLERVNATVTDRGLEVDGLYFDAPDNAELKRMKAEATIGKVSYVPAHVDRLSTGQIYWAPADITKAPLLIPLSHYSRNARGLSFTEAKQRADFRYASTKDAKTALNPRKHHQSEAQANATNKDRDAVAEQHGSIAARNDAAKGTDLEQVKKDQAERDNTKVAFEMHGANGPSSETKEGASPGGDAANTKLAVRPSVFN